MVTIASLGLEAETVAMMLDAGRVPNDGVLVVHSAFGGLSRAGHRAEGFIEALLERLKHGTLIMPAMTWRTVTPDNPVWDEQTTASHVGVLSEIFRTRYAELRSVHPTHSVSARGPAAKEFVAGHFLHDTPCPAESPWGRLAAHDAHILLIGIGFENCTVLHHPEEIVAPEFYLKPASEAVLYHCTDRNGIVRVVPMRHHVRLDRDFPQYDRRPYTRDRMARGRIAGTDWRLIRARDLMDDAFANLRARRDAHIARAS
jgi:aminoglycoside 3-N-acetyltransferase